MNEWGNKPMNEWLNDWMNNTTIECNKQSNHPFPFVFYDQTTIQRASSNYLAARHRPQSLPTSREAADRCKDNPCFEDAPASNPGVSDATNEPNVIQNALRVCREGLCRTGSAAWRRNRPIDTWKDAHRIDRRNWRRGLGIQNSEEKGKSERTD